MKEKFGIFKNTDMFSHISTMNYIPRWIILFIDIIICLIAFSIAAIISKKLNENVIDHRLVGLPIRLSVVISLQVVFFWIFHTYSGVIRYSGFVDAVKLLFAVSSNLLVLMISTFLSYYFYGEYIFYPSGLIFYAIISFLLLFLLRLTVKIGYDLFVSNTGNIIPVMIYGTKAPAIGIANMITSSQEETKYKLVGFIDEDNTATQRLILGIKVYALNNSTIKTIHKKVKAVIVSPLKMREINTEKDLDIFINNNISVLTFPTVGIWKNEKPTLKQIKSLQIEELLERPQINISTENIAQEHKSKIVLITGAAGSIGSEIANQIMHFGAKLVVLVDQAESPLHTLKLELENKFSDQNFTFFLGDVRNKVRMEYMMDLFRPDIIYHAAAYKHVPMMEDNPIESIQTNVIGTKNIADLAIKYNVSRFVMVSTDKAVNPTNIMGASKRIAEIYVQSLFRKNYFTNNTTTKFITTRFGNVLGSNGSVIPLFKNQIEKGGPVTVTHPEIIRYFMTIPEACMLVLEAGVMGNGGEIYIFDMGNPVKIVNLARKMIRLAGYIPDIDIKIEYTGLRPGEKLFEELLNQKEITIATHNPKIMIAKVMEYNFDEISGQIDELIKYSLDCKNYLTVTQMKKIVPEFKSKNSLYEKLDV